mmetsp:Transcript_20984/g.58115  ORF Transcript_20984/g.58115 Transcript_20984/m.58115 type:complete len:289 (-) Transcript_20984:89-955(-)
MVMACMKARTQVLAQNSKAALGCSLIKKPETLGMITPAALPSDVHMLRALARQSVSKPVAVVVYKSDHAMSKGTIMARRATGCNIFCRVTREYEKSAHITEVMPIALQRILGPWPSRARKEARKKPTMLGNFRKTTKPSTWRRCQPWSSPSSVSQAHRSLPKVMNIQSKPKAITRFKMRMLPSRCAMPRGSLSTASSASSSPPRGSGTDTESGSPPFVLQMVRRCSANLFCWPVWCMKTGLSGMYLTRTRATTAGKESTKRKGRHTPSGKHIATSTATKWPRTKKICI